MLVFVACDGPAGQDRDPGAGGRDGTRPETTATATGTKEPSRLPGKLVGTVWSLTELEGHGLVKETAITLNFRRGNVGGNAGCNYYNADKVRVGEGTIEFSTISATEMACGKAGGDVMAQEQRYLRALGEAAAYRMEGEQLEIRNDAGEKTLLFEKGTG